MQSKDVKSFWDTLNNFVNGGNWSKRTKHNQGLHEHNFKRRLKQPSCVTHSRRSHFLSLSPSPCLKLHYLSVLLALVLSSPLLSNSADQTNRALSTAGLVSNSVSGLAEQLDLPKGNRRSQQGQIIILAAASYFLGSIISWSTMDHAFSREVYKYGHGWK